MEQNKSAILQMLMGERGNFECIRFSEEYRKARKKSLDKLLEFEKQLTSLIKLPSASSPLNTSSPVLKGKKFPIELVLSVRFVAGAS